MAPDVAPIERLEEHAMAVDPRAIEDEFGRIWLEASSTGADESSVRVRVLNLVAIASSEEDVTRFEDVMQVLPQRHPCRGLMAVAAPAYDRLGATISAHCWRSGGARRQVCSEEVLLTGASHQQRELASAVLALLVPEVPVAVWLMGEPALRGDLAARVLDAADSALLDSAQFADVRAAYRSALALLEERDVRCADLAWGRLSVWRALIAQLFDGEHGARELDQIRSIEIRGAAGARSSEALLLGAWLAARLGLALADSKIDGGRLDAAFYDGTRELRLSIASGGALAIDDVRMRTFDADFLIERHADSGHMHVRENWDSGSTRRIVEQSPSDDASVLALMLDGISTNDVYEEALRMALTLIER